MRLVKLVLISLICVTGLCYAQSGALSWSIYQPILNVANPTPPFTSNVFTNVGQTTHEVVVTLSPIPTHLCPQLDATQSSLQFSMDGITYTNFGVAILPGNNALGLTFLFVGTGAYPRVRFVLGQYDNADCNVTANYSGATTNPYTQIVGSSSNGTPAPPPVVIGGVGSGGTTQAFSACNQTQGGTIAAGTTTQVTTFPVVTPSNQTVKICSLALSASIAATGTLIMGTGATCATGTITQFVAPLAAGIPFPYGVGIGSVVTGTPGQTFCITAAGNPVNYTISWATF